jgi:hypothetical protein
MGHSMTSAAVMGRLRTTVQTLAGGSRPGAPIGVGGVVFECVETHAPAGATLLLYADGLVALLEPTEDVLRFEVGDDSPQVPRTPDSADRTDLADRAVR